MPIIKKSEDKYKYSLTKKDENYDPTYDGVVWTVKRDIGIPGFVVLTNSNREEGEGRLSIQTRRMVIPESRLTKEFHAVAEQNITAESKNEPNNELGNGVEPVAAPASIFVEKQKSESDDEWGSFFDRVWSGLDIFNFMRKFDVDHDILWTQKEIDDFTKQIRHTHKCDETRHVPEQKPEPKPETTAGVRRNCCLHTGKTCGRCHADGESGVHANDLGEKPQTAGVVDAESSDTMDREAFSEAFGRAAAAFMKELLNGISE